MSVDCTGEPGGGAIRRSAAGAADWLYLAAAPTFAVMIAALNCPTSAWAIAMI